MTALERAQSITEQAAPAGLQFNRQRQVFETQPGWRVIEQFNVRRFAEVMFDFQAHFTPAAERKTAGHLPCDARCWQALQAQGIEHRQGQ